MAPLFDEVETRVIGALIEKQITTPDNYPLTLNSLIHACNQTSNRDPVVSYDQATVERALDSLRAKNMAYVFYGSESRVPKYKQMMTHLFHLTPQETAVMDVLMLRGPQTVGELRGRTSRLFDFADLAEVEATLEGLMAREEQPLVVRLPRQAGRKDPRYAHVLAGDAGMTERDEGHEKPARETRAGDDRVSVLEAEVAALREQVAELKKTFEEFRRQFD